MATAKLMSMRLMTNTPNTKILPRTFFMAKHCARDVAVV
jgi:hypothetical protein